MDITQRGASKDIYKEVIVMMHHGISEVKRKDFRKVIDNDMYRLMDC